jgi:putative methyltransferase (TIGR04325 family)
VNAGEVQAVGLGNYFPLDVSRRIVPRLPQRWQRFTSAPSWTAAEAQSIGYVEVPVAPPPTTVLPRQPLVGNQIALVGAFGVALGARSPSDSPIRVVDFGGYDGKHADLIQSVFSELSFEWVVVDLSPVVGAMSGRSRPGLEFTSDLLAALDARADVFLASASLNYVPNPIAMLGTMCTNASFVVLTRLPLWPIESHAAAVQHTQRRPVEISYPTWFFSEQQFMTGLPTGSKILLDFVCPDDRASFEGQYLTYRGLVIATYGAEMQGRQ